MGKRRLIASGCGMPIIRDMAGRGGGEEKERGTNITAPVEVDIPTDARPTSPESGKPTLTELPSVFFR